MDQSSKFIIEIYHSIMEFSGQKPEKGISVKKMTKIISKEFKIRRKECIDQKQEFEKINNRIDEILEVIQSLACLNYSKKAKVLGTDDQIDALAAGINMMGEELEASTVSLTEKELLLNEVHHRVKNNLQLVSSLLNIQSSYISDPFALAKFKESQNRVNSMALIHEKLYTSKDFTKIDFGDYLNSITHYLSAVYNINPQLISVDIDINPDSGFLPLDTALPCGLIINELMSNSFKYAFPNGKKGKITCVMKQKKSKNKIHYEIVFRDNGIGLPEKINFEKSKTLGMQLVTTLTDQIDGELKYDYKNGACFTISFSNLLT